MNCSATNHLLDNGHEKPLDIAASQQSCITGNRGSIDWVWLQGTKELVACAACSLGTYYIHSTIVQIGLYLARVLETSSGFFWPCLALVAVFKSTFEDLFIWLLAEMYI